MRRRPRSPVWARLVGTILAAVLAAGSLAGCGADKVRANSDVTIATGGRQGVYYAYGTGLAQQLGPRVDGAGVSALSTEGSVENLNRVSRGEAQFGFSAADAAVDAMNSPNGADSPIRAVARLYDDYIHLVVPAQSPLSSVRDLLGHRVGVGSPASGVALVSARVLHAAGLTPGVDVEALPLGLDDAIEALQSGTIDAFFWSGGLPTNGITTLAISVPIRLLPLSEVADSLRRDFGSTYRLALVPANTYPGIPAVTSLAMANYLITAAAVPDDMVELVAEVLYDRRVQIATVAPVAATFDRREAIFTAPVPLHPGAQRYYRSIKP